MSTDVSLAEFKALSDQTRHRKRCRIEAVMTGLSDAERAQLEAALAADKLDISAGAVARWCERRGSTVSHQNVVSHRARACSCYVGA